MSKTPGTPATTYNDCDCVPGHRCDCWDYRKQDERFDAAAEDVHRAFCDPEHEMVGEWDRNMADALRRRRLAIVREAEASAPITVEARCHPDCTLCKVLDEMDADAALSASEAG